MKKMSKILFVVLTLIFTNVASKATSQEWQSYPLIFLDVANYIGFLVPYPEIINVSLFAGQLIAIPARLETPKDFSSSPSTLVEATAVAVNSRKSRIEPISEQSEDVDFQVFLQRISYSKYKFGPLIWNLHSRRNLGLGMENDINSRIDEHYTYGTSFETFLEFKYSPEFSIFTGKKNSTFGNSLGVNPVDVFLDSRELDYRLPLKRQRSEVTGTDSVGFDYFNDSLGNISVVAAPEYHVWNKNRGDRFLLNYGTLLGEDAVEIDLFGFFDGAPSMGASVSALTTQGLTLYSDLTVRQGGKIQRVKESPAMGIVEFEEIDDDQIIPSVTIGSSISIGENMLIDAEYTYLSDGFTQNEWNNFDSAITLSNSDETVGAISTMDKLRAIADYPYLRRDYGFLRLYSDNLLWRGFETELSTLIGLNDFSGRTNLNLSQSITEYLDLTVQAGIFFGKDDSEFSLTNVGEYVGSSIVITY